MKKNIRQFATVFGLSALLGTAALVAQTHKAVAKVPFGFHVKDTVLPPGQYSVAQDTNSVLEVRSASTGTTFLVMTGAKNPTARQDAHLTFKRYGNEYFLTEVSLPDTGLNMRIPPSAQEKEFAKSGQIVALVSVTLDGE